MHQCLCSHKWMPSSTVWLSGIRLGVPRKFCFQDVSSKRNGSTIGLVPISTEELGLPPFHRSWCLCLYPGSALHLFFLNKCKWCFLISKSFNPQKWIPLRKKFTDAIKRWCCYWFDLSAVSSNLFEFPVSYIEESKVVFGGWRGLSGGVFALHVWALLASSSWH